MQYLNKSLNSWIVRKCEDSRFNCSFHNCSCNEIHVINASSLFLNCSQLIELMKYLLEFDHSAVIFIILWNRTGHLEKILRRIHLISIHFYLLHEYFFMIYCYKRIHFVREFMSFYWMDGDLIKYINRLMEFCMQEFSN